jgi:hypothetical protein
MQPRSRILSNGLVLQGTFVWKGLLTHFPVPLVPIEIQLAQGKKKIAMNVSVVITVRDKQQSSTAVPMACIAPRGLLIPLFARLASTALPIPPIHAFVPKITTVLKVQLFRLHAIVGHIVLLGQDILSCVLLATKLLTRATSLSSFSLPMPLLVKLASLENMGTILPG